MEECFSLDLDLSFPHILLPFSLFSLYNCTLLFSILSECICSPYLASAFVGFFSVTRKGNLHNGKSVSFEWNRMQLQHLSQIYIPKIHFFKLKNTHWNHLWGFKTGENHVGWMKCSNVDKLLFSRIQFFGLGTQKIYILSAFLFSLYSHFSFISLQLLNHSRNCMMQRNSFCCDVCTVWTDERRNTPSKLLSIYFSLFPRVIAVSSLLVQNAPGWILTCIFLSFTTQSGRFPLKITLWNRVNSCLEICIQVVLTKR